MADTFWLVWNEAARPPTYKHPTIESAKAEAERLARGTPGEKFHVLKLQGTCTWNAVRWDIADDDPSAIPF